MQGVVNELIRHLAHAGFRSAVVSVARLPELPKGLETLLERGALRKDAYDAIRGRYGLDFMYEPPQGFPARSVIITAAPQPKIRIGFSVSGRMFAAIIPPTYVHDTDAKVLDVISEELRVHGYRAIDALLPGKRLAVQSGMARYGRNNIAYVEDLGSYFRLRAYFSDMPCSDRWQDVRMMDLCEKCTACVRHCPTKAILKDQFVINASRCLTFLNEGEDRFPDGIDPSWHHCLIGCMICQDICPANKDHRDWVVDGVRFSEEETGMIRSGVPAKQLPAETAAKLKEIDMLGSEKVLQRNLNTLIDAHKNGG